MKAVICSKYGPPEVLQVSEVEKPTSKKNEVCVKIFAAAVTPSDCVYRGAKIPLWHPVGFLMRLAFGFIKPRNHRIGMVLAGEVESIGKNVKRFKKGDQVYGMVSLRFGTYAQYKCLSEKECLVKKPANISYEQAASITWAGLIACNVLKKANVKRSHRVLIYGASGAIGTVAVQLAKCLGAKVTGVCGTADLELVKSLGAEIVIDYTKENLTDRNERYDFVLDAVGKNNCPKLETHYKELLSENGRYASVDNGMPNSKIENLTFINQLITSGMLKPIIERSFPLEQIIEAHRYSDDWFKKGNVVVAVDHPVNSD